MCRAGYFALIHERAIVDPSVCLAPGVHIGAYSIIGPDVEIGEDSRVGPHVVINGPTKIGRNNRIYQFTSIGDAPQDKKYGGESTRLEIGDGNVIREFCTINRGTVQDTGVTRIGNNNWIMAYVHIAHDCWVGNGAIFGNNATLAGHVTIQDYVTLSAFTGVYQFCTIGAQGFTAVLSAVNKDVPPYMLVSGRTARPYGLNVEGLKRRDFAPQTIRLLRKAYRTLYRSGLSLKQAMEQLQELGEECAEVAVLVEFLRNSKRGIVR